MCYITSDENFGNGWGWLYWQQLRPGNSERTNLEVTRALLKILGQDEPMIEYVPHRPGHDARYAIDSSKIKNTLGWEPETTFEESLAQTVKWFQENEWWWRPLKEGRPLIDPKDQRKLHKSINNENI